MAMTPEERAEFEEMKETLRAIQRVEDVPFIENINRRITFPTLKLSDLSDVSDTDSASTGEVLKKTSTTWQPGTDNTV